MTIKIAVCDDEHSASRQIDVYISQIQQETGLQFQIFYFSSGEELLANMPRDVKILLLDIQMAKVSGIDAARQLREEGADFYLFFITSNVQYALEGYEVHAYAFLRKPLQYALLKNYLVEVVRRIEGSKPFTLQLKSAGGLDIIDCATIVYIEVYGHSTTIVFDDKRKVFSASLNDLEAQLNSHEFFRCHKSYLINLHKITSVCSTDIRMSNDDVIPLSKHRKQELLVALKDAVGR